MFKNTFQSGFLSILYSIGSKPLQIWEKKVSVVIQSDISKHANLFFLSRRQYLMLHEVKKLFISNVVPNHRLQNVCELLKYVYCVVTAVAKQQVIAIIANRPFVTAFSGIKVSKVVLLPLCVISSSMSLLIIIEYYKFTSFTCFC